MANLTLEELRTRLLAQLKEKFEKDDSKDVPKKDDKDQDDEKDSDYKDSDDKDSPQDDSDEDQDETNGKGQDDDETDISKDSGKKDKIEVKEETDLVESMLSNISEQKGPEAKEIFEDIIMSKIVTRLEKMKQEVMGEATTLDASPEKRIKKSIEDDKRKAQIGGKPVDFEQLRRGEYPNSKKMEK